MINLSERVGRMNLMIAMEENLIEVEALSYWGNIRNSLVDPLSERVYLRLVRPILFCEEGEFS